MLVAISGKKLFKTIIDKNMSSLALIIDRTTFHLIWSYVYAQEKSY